MRRGAVCASNFFAGCSCIERWPASLCLVSSFYFECLLRRTATGARKRRWVNRFVIMMKPLLMATLCHRGRLLTETIGDLQSAMSIVLFACYKHLVESQGSSNHSGWTAMDTSFHRGWLVSEHRVHWQYFWCILKRSCFVRLFLTWLWALAVSFHV